MARACKYVTRAVIGQYSGLNFPVMPTGIMSDVNALLVKRKYKKCESTFGSNQGGGSNFPYILLNEIQTMFSQLAKQSVRF